MTSIVVEYGNPVYDSRENCNAIIETSSSTLIRGCDNTIIPDGIRSICSAAFSACRNLTSLIIPTSVTSIGEEAFINCSALISVTIPYGITCIPQNVFFGCSGLKSVIIPNSVKSISNDAFHNAGLTSIKIPDGITTIGSFAFCNCLNLASVIIPNDVTSIGQRAFSECRSLSSVISEIKEPFAFDSYAFFSIASNCTLTVPYGTKDAYIAAGWTEDVFKGGIIEAPNNLMPDNYLTMNNAEACKGESVVLPVNLNNTESITALQFEMALPAGITISKCQLTDRKGDDHTASYRKLVNGNYQVTVISLSKAVFSGTEGAVVNLTLDVDKDVAVGDYPINITNIELTTAVTQAVNPADVTATLTVSNVKIGDVDGNGKVSITDAVAIVSHILGEDIDGFVAAAADVDGNGKITITDAVAVVDMILNGGSQSSNNLKKGTNVIADLGMKDVDPTQPWTTKSNGGSSGNKGNYGDYWKGVGQKYFFDYTDKNDRMFGNHEKGNTCMGFYGDGIDDNPDIYQIVKIPAGHYTIRVQAFYRDASGQQITECLTNYKNGQSKKNAWAYVDTYADETSATAGTAPIRSFTTAIRHIFDTDCTEKLCNWTPNGDDWRNDRSFTMDSDGGEGAGQAITYYYPNSITGASYYFKNGYYWNELDISLNQETYVRIGLRKTDYVAYDWLASSEWQIIYNGEPTENLLGWSAE